MVLVPAIKPHYIHFGHEDGIVHRIASVDYDSRIEDGKRMWYVMTMCGEWFDLYLVDGNLFPVFETPDETETTCVGCDIANGDAP